jgi:hypothetical protein
MRRRGQRFLEKILHDQSAGNDDQQMAIKEKMLFLCANTNKYSAGNKKINFLHAWSEPSPLLPGLIPKF